MANEFPLSLIIKAVDKATAPLREINRRMQAFTAPVRKLNNSFRALSDEAGLPRLVKGFSGVGKAVASVGQEALALGLKIAGMAAGAGYALYRIMRGSVDAGDKLAEMAQRVGLGVDAFAQLQFAAAQADVEQESFNSSMDQFNKRLGEMKADSGPLLAFLNNVAPTLAMQMKGAKNTEEALGLMTRAFEKVTDPGKRAALAAAAFGKSGLQMGQFLGQGGKEIEKQRKRYLELAGSQEAFAKGAGDADNAVREAETAFLGLRNAASAELFPALTELAKAVAGLLSGNRGALAAWAREAGAAITSWVKGGGLQQLVATMRQWGETTGRLVEMIGGLKGVLVLVGAFMAAPLVSAILGVVSALGSLGGAVLPMVIKGVGLLWPLLVSAGAALAPFVVAAAPFLAAAAAIAGAAYLIYKRWEPIKLFFKLLWDDLQPIIGAIGKIAEWSPLGLAAKGGRFLASKVFGADDARPMLGATPSMMAPAAGSAHVTVDFNNVPRGARVTEESGGTANLDLSMGYSMIGATP